MNDEGENGELDSSALLARLDGRRGMYFHSWLLGEWANDPQRLEHVSVTEIIRRYDQHCESSRANAADNPANK